LNLVFGREFYRTHGQRLRLVNYYILPLMLLSFLLSYFLIANRAQVDISAFFAFAFFAALSGSAVLLFRLSRERTARRKAEKIAKVNSARLANIFNSGILGLLYTRFDGVITEANDLFLDMIGYSRDDLEEGKISWVEMTPPEYNDVSQTALAQLRETGVCQTFSKEYWRKDGERVHVLLGSSVLNPGDNAEILTYAINITNLKKSEKREAELTMKIRHQQEEMFRILNQAPIAIVIRKGPDLTIEYANQTTLKYTPYKPGEAAGKSADDFHRDLKTGIDISPLKAVYNSGKSVSGKAHRVEFDRDGNGSLTEGWFDYLWEPTFDQDGKVNGVATFTFEVSDLVRANSKIKANEQHFRFIADAIPHKVWTSTPDGSADYYNKGWKAYLDEENVPELRSKAWAALHPDDLETTTQAWKTAVERGEDMEIEHRLKRYDGAYQWHLTRVSACKDDQGKVTMYVGSSTNIHEQKLANIALRISGEKKDEFLGVATHELRTPITSMKAALQSLDRSVSSGSDLTRSLPLVKLANRQVEKLTNIVNDIVDVSKLQADKLALNRSSIVFNNCVNDAVHEFRFQYPDCSIETEERDQIYVSADKIRLEQVISNLLSNAFKYSNGKGTIKINIRQDADQCMCSVTDEGIGIAADLQPFIFDRFFRVHTSSQTFSGLGLGLFIASEIIKKHNGSIHVQSEEGKGSRFWFTLPATERPKETVD